MEIDKKFYDKTKDLLCEIIENASVDDLDIFKRYVETILSSNKLFRRPHIFTTLKTKEKDLKRGAPPYPPWYIYKSIVFDTPR